MKKVLFLLSPILLIGCAGAAYQLAPMQPQAPTATEIQGVCFTDFKVFTEQTNCIRSAYIRSNLTSNSYGQEYLSYMDALQAEVNQKKLSESQARIELTSKHNQLRAEQQNESAMQQQLDIQRAQQNAEILKQYKPIEIKMYPVPQHRTINTNCSAYGNQVNCTTQ